MFGVLLGEDCVPLSSLSTQIPMAVIANSGQAHLWSNMNVHSYNSTTNSSFNLSSCICPVQKSQIRNLAAILAHIIAQLQPAATIG